MDSETYQIPSIEFYDCYAINQCSIELMEDMINVSYLQDFIRQLIEEECKRLQLNHQDFQWNLLYNGMIVQYNIYNPFNDWLIKTFQDCYDQQGKLLIQPKRKHMIDLNKNKNDSSK
jgi:hypothetical protein